MNRRDLLKYFGVGVAIAPLSAGPIVTLVEPPKVELAKALPSEVPIVMRDVRNVTVLFEMADGSHRCVQGEVDYSRGVIRGPRVYTSIQFSPSLSPHEDGGHLEVKGLMV